MSDVKKFVDATKKIAETEGKLQKDLHLAKGWTDAMIKTPSTGNRIEARIAAERVEKDRKELEKLKKDIRS